MDCFNHARTAAVGICVACQKAICRECVGRDQPRLICRTCTDRSAVFGFEYRSQATVAGWPLIHVCTGINPATMRPKVAKGVIAIGNVAVGGLAIAGAAFGLVSVGGFSVGLLLAVGGAAVGVGLSIGGLAVGAVAVGGAAFGLAYAIGGAAFGPAVANGQQCDPELVAFVTRWLGPGFLPPGCR